MCFPAALLCGVTFAGLQFTISNFVGPQLTDLIASLCALGVLVVLFMFWKPKDNEKYELSAAAKAAETSEHSTGQVFLAWSPYFLLVICVLLWGWAPMVSALEFGEHPDCLAGLAQFDCAHSPGHRQSVALRRYFQSELAVGFGNVLHDRLHPVLFRAARAAAAGLKIFFSTMRQLTFSLITLACVLGLAYLMNYSGATGTLGLAFAATGASFPFFSAILGWLGVFLTGSDTSANALFGNLQVVTATKLGFNPVLMASANSAGGVMGKMISLSSIAVAAAATNMAPDEEAKLFRFTLKHSALLACVIGLIALFYTYVAPGCSRSRFRRADNGIRT